MSCIFNRRYANADERREVIKKVEDVINKNAFEYYKQKFYVANNEYADDKVMKQLFTDYKLLNQVLERFKSFCPLLKPMVCKGEKSAEKNTLVTLALKLVDWKKLNSEIYELLETHGDVFFYIYFEDDKLDYKIPRISLLKSENMINIIKDDANTTVAYIYEENLKQEEIDYNTGEVKDVDLGDARFIFKKGEVIRYIADKKEKGMMSIDSKGKLKILRQKNANSYSELIPIIHIAGNKRQDEKFSVIPAQDYVETCLHLMQIQSDIRATNRQLGFPRITLVDCKFVEGDGRIGGIKRAETVVSKELEDTFASNVRGQVIQHNSATNESFFKEEDRVTDYLYNLVGVTNPTLMQRVGSSDSSKVIQQVNARMERKVETYIDSIIEAFNIYFKILFLENNLYEERDENFSFEKPRSILKNSAYDDLLIDTMGINSGVYTIKDILRNQGKTETEIEEHFNQINSENINGNKDVSVNKTQEEKETNHKVKKEDDIE